MKLSIVVPVYRSQDCLPALIAAIDKALQNMSYEIILVNDYSPDHSWQVIQELCLKNTGVIGIDLRKNFGQDNAIMTGLRVAQGDCVAIMDDDLQHNPADLPALIQELERGYDVVYAKFREKKQKLWKNLGSYFNGKFAEWVIDKPKSIYLSPYKVVRKEVIELACKYDGPYPYVDGLLLNVTSRITQIPVDHQDRFAGESTYTFWKSVHVWMRLAISFSVKPLRWLTWSGIAFSILGFLGATFTIAYALFFPTIFGKYAAGWASLMTMFMLLSGAQMFFLGLLGEYSGKTYLRVNNKPQTSVREILRRNN